MFLYEMLMSRTGLVAATPDPISITGTTGRDTSPTSRATFVAFYSSNSRILAVSMLIEETNRLGDSLAGATTGFYLGSGPARAHGPIRRTIRKLRDPTVA